MEGQVAQMPNSHETPGGSAGHGIQICSMWEDCEGPCMPAKHCILQSSNPCLQKCCLRLSLCPWPDPMLT